MHFTSFLTTQLLLGSSKSFPMFSMHRKNIPSSNNLQSFPYVDFACFAKHANAISDEIIEVYANSPQDDQEIIKRLASVTGFEKTVYFLRGNRQFVVELANLRRSRKEKLFNKKMAVFSRRIFARVKSVTRQISLTSSESNLLAEKRENSQSTECFRVSESNPANHTNGQLSGFYTIPESDVQIFSHGGLPKPFMQHCATFNETCLMIRKPAIEVIDLMKSADYSNPPMKYVMYGVPGTGKSLVLAHILHYAYCSKFLILHVPWVGTWLRSPKEVANSQVRPGFVDLPENAVKWLLHFKIQNQSLIKELDLRLTKDYEWSKRETSSIGDPLLDIVELGLNRSRHASEIMIAIAKEVKGYCKEGKCKAVVAVDGINAFFHPKTRVINEERAVMPPEKVTIVLAFLELTKSDWHNAAMLLTCDEMAVPGHDKSPNPLYQLGINGFHHLDPFVPIDVPLMNETEMRNVLAYYRDRKWIQDWNADDELLFLCGGNPYQLMNFCNPL